MELLLQILNIKHATLFKGGRMDIARADAEALRVSATSSKQAYPVLVLVGSTQRAALGLISES